MNGAPTALGRESAKLEPLVAVFRRLSLIIDELFFLDTMNLSPNDFCRMGLQFAKMTLPEQETKGVAKCYDLFRALYGSPPEVLSDLWEDLCITNIAAARVPVHEQNPKGLKMYLIANYFLWTYPRSAKLIEAHFAPIAEIDTRGRPLWKWIDRIAAILPDKIQWLPALDDPNEPAFIVSVDGVHCRTDERRDHPLFPMNRARYSQKYKHAGLTYEIGVAVYEQKIVWVNGPYQAGTNDLSMLRQGKPDGSGSILDKVQPGKMLVLDRGYQTSRPTEQPKMAFKSNDDPPELCEVKARTMCRHETVNGRIKQFKFASETFRHSDPQHGIGFMATCVLVQCQLDCGAAFLYDV